MLSENYKYLMSKYKLSHLDWNLSLMHVLNKIKVSPLSVYELSVCNTVRELCQLRDFLHYSNQSENVYNQISIIYLLNCGVSTTWNSLPKELRIIKSFILFKKHLKTYLFNL